MGNQNSKLSQNQLSNFQNNPDKYTVIEKSYGGLILKQNETSKYYLLNQFICIQKQKYQNLLKDFQILKDHHYDYLLNLVSLQKQQYGHFCRSSYKISVIYEYSYSNLNLEIQTRKESSRYFLEKDLINIIRFILCLISEYQNQQKIIIVPHRILIFEDGTLKLAHKAVQLLNQDQSLLQFITPDKFQGKHTQIKLSQIQELQKQLIFSLGMTLLSASVLEDCFDCYDFKQNLFRFSVLQEKLQKCINTFSQKFSLLVSDLLQTSQVQRLSLVELEQRLKYYDNKNQSESNINNNVTLSCSNLEITQKNRPEPFNFASKSHQQIFEEKICSISIHSNERSSFERKITFEKNILAPIQIYNQNNRHNKSNFAEVSNLFISEIRMQNHNHLETQNNRTYQSIIQKLSSKKIPKKFKSKKIKNGKIRIEYPNGSIYEGNLEQNKMHGYGVYYYQENKPAYKGQWYSQKFHGKGILYNQFPQKLNEPFNYKDFNELQNYWEYYQGDFILDSKSGKGRLYLTNGQFYEGQFHNDSIEGYGQYHKKNGIIRGQWLANQLIK